MATLEIMEYDESHKTAQSLVESAINQWLGAAGRVIGAKHARSYGAVLIEKSV
jgi:hypothetical protein